MDRDFGQKYWRYLNEGPKFVFVWVDGGENMKGSYSIYRLNFHQLVLVITCLVQAIWDKLPKCIFENFEIGQFKES